MRSQLDTEDGTLIIDVSVLMKKKKSTQCYHFLSRENVDSKIDKAGNRPTMNLQAFNVKRHGFRIVRNKFPLLTSYTVYSTLP